MKFKKMNALFCALLLLTGCAGGVASIQPQNSPQATPAPAGGAVRTGLAVIASTDSSRDASETQDGLMQTDLTMVALTIDDQGMIDQCVIDGLQAGIGFDASGSLTTDPAAQFPTKNELGAQYGLGKASGIGREWNEQAAAFAAYARGKTIDQIAALALNGQGKPTGAELVSSVTISVNDFIHGIQAAAQNAQHLGAQQGDSLRLTCLADASASTNGSAQLEAAIAAVSLNGGGITSCAIDGVRSAMTFDAASDASISILSSNAAWREQAAAFCAGLKGSTIAEAGAAQDADPEGFELFRAALARLMPEGGAQAGI